MNELLILMDTLRHRIEDEVPPGREKSITLTELETAQWRLARALGED